MGIEHHRKGKSYSLLHSPPFATGDIEEIAGVTCGIVRNYARKESLTLVDCTLMYV